MGWLQNHLETFVQPILGYIPELSKDDRRIFSPSEMAIIKNMWRSVKQESKRLKKPILLAGRDVFIFEILARREGYPTVFRPDISRLTAQYVKEDYSQHFLFDTGFMGSIPKTLRCESFTMGSSNKVGIMLEPEWPFKSRIKHPLIKSDPKQVFPRMKGARSLILKIERTPKYWRRGFCTEHNEIKQDLAEPVEFLRAAKLTIEIYKDSSPTFIDAPVEVTGHYDALTSADFFTD